MKPVVPLFGPIDGLFVVVSEWLVGARRGFKQGQTVYLSPAMWSLLENAESADELRRLLETIEVMPLPSPFGRYGPADFGVGVR